MKEEIVDVYDLEGKFLHRQGRTDYYMEVYQEYRDKGSVSTQLRVVKGLILNPSGRCYLQLRSKVKTENRGLLDKTVGGHVAHGTSDYIAFILECQQELGIPVAVVPNDQFLSTLRSVDLSILGIVKELEVVNAFYSTRCLPNGEAVVLPQIVTFYLGYFNGPIQFQDGEASGILSFSQKELLEEFVHRKKAFTEDIVFMLERFGVELKAL
ncbi:MAG: NUDIX domain-containing protein [Patescibacteria group bacterium]